MSRFIRALVVSGIATGVVVAVGSMLRGGVPALLQPAPPLAASEVDADGLDPAYTDRLLRELDAQF